jgi:hypothetical protein
MSSEEIDSLWFRRMAWSLNKETLALLEKQEKELTEWVEKEIAKIDKTKTESD